MSYSILQLNYIKVSKRRSNKNTIYLAFKLCYDSRVMYKNKKVRADWNPDNELLMSCSIL